MNNTVAYIPSSAKVFYDINRHSTQENHAVPRRIATLSHIAIFHAESNSQAFQKQHNFFFGNSLNSLWWPCKKNHQFTPLLFPAAAKPVVPFPDAKLPALHPATSLMMVGCSWSPQIPATIEGKMLIIFLWSLQSSPYISQFFFLFCFWLQVLGDSFAVKCFCHCFVLLK